MAFKTVFHKSEMGPYISIEINQSVLSQDGHRILFTKEKRKTKKSNTKKGQHKAVFRRENSNACIIIFKTQKHQSFIFENSKVENSKD
jgi:hypothetical protein